MIGILILASLLLGSTVSLIVTPRIIEYFHLHLYKSSFAQTVMHNSTLADQKTFDLVEIILFFSVSLFFFFIHLTVRKTDIQSTLVLVFGALLLFMQSHFVVHSIKLMLIQIIVLEFIFIIWSRAKKKLVYDYNSLANGLFVGFYLFIVFRLLTTSFVIPFFIFITFPLLFLQTRWGRKASLAFPILVLSSFFPYSKICLSLILLVSVVLSRIRKFSNLNVKKLYPYIILFIFIYNPLFYVGTFDSLEEGFWLAWTQRLIDGKVLYKNFAVYHPPLFTWGLYLFMKINEYSLYFFRLYFHILQIVGTMIIYSLIRMLIKGKKLQIITFLFILSVLTRNLMNNVEIRLGLGLLSLLPLFIYLERKLLRNIIYSGMISGIALFSSVEVGIASIMSIIISIIFIAFFTKQKVIRLYSSYVLGLSVVCFTIASVLHYQGAFTEFIEQMKYVLYLFGSGYSNASIERTKLNYILLWNEVYSYLSSTSWFWEFTRFSTLGSLLYVLYKRVVNKVTRHDLYVLLVSILTAMLFRTALGRSDHYHMLTVFVPSVIVLAATLEKFGRKHLPIVIMILLLLISGRNKLNEFLHFNLEKFQSYATPAGLFPDYLSDRTDIQAFPGTDTVLEHELITTIKEYSKSNETIFVFPQKPELYFLTERSNATSFDTPIIYLTESYQKQMVFELERNNPNIIVYNPRLSFYEISVNNFEIVNNYINDNYQEKIVVGDWILLEKLNN